MSAGKHKVFIGLGGNVGDVLSSMAHALNYLDGHSSIQLLAVSPVYKTPPWGIIDQDWFHNACAEFETSLTPQEMLEQCLGAEKNLKRIRKKRWGPRTIDLDILVFDDLNISIENLTIPHPRMHERSFVLKPLTDLAPDLQVKGKSITEWLKNVGDEPLEQVDLEENWISEFL